MELRSPWRRSSPPPRSDPSGARKFGGTPSRSQPIGPVAHLVRDALPFTGVPTRAEAAPPVR